MENTGRGWKRGLGGLDPMPLPDSQGPFPDAACSSRSSHHSRIWSGPSLETFGMVLLNPTKVWTSSVGVQQLFTLAEALTLSLCKHPAHPCQVWLGCPQLTALAKAVQTEGGVFAI